MDSEYIELKPVPRQWLYLLAGIFLLSGVLLFVLWDRIPDPMPTHWGFSGEPDSFKPKTPGAVFGMIAAGGIPLGVVAPSVVYTTHYQAKHAHEGLPHKSVEEVDRIRATTNETVPLLANFMLALTALVIGAVTFSLLGFLRGPLLTGLVIAGIVLLLVWFVRDLMAAQRRVANVVGHDENSQNMHWGMFYYNRNDDRVLIEHGLGTTLNWANPGSWLLMGVVLMPLALIILVTVLN
ncbi:DUF1648 domain-containing protein [Corynebacterium lubricantis]|uniref:DUF1648 domain-containing protein n=1 Tax=Corynebacterium lubricantis TaxID=541095 RepID=UPI000374B7B7|nr:DUF1648 domain-containing protein [Corynebacterium lubricantis]